MREIKFRAWNDYARKMDYNPWGPEYSTEGTPVNDCVANIPNLMQFTGLKDKNGKEIYEGDVVFNEHDENRQYPVVFDRGMFCIGDWEMPLWKGAPQDFWEVIGNVYENPELTEKK